LAEKCSKIIKAELANGKLFADFAFFLLFLHTVKNDEIMSEKR